MATRAVYSTPFIQYTDATPNDAYQVPPNFTAVIRQISVLQTAGAFSWFVYIGDSSEAVGLKIASGESAGFYNSDAAEGRWVVPENGYITINVSTVLSGLNLYVGGYLLNGNIASP